MLLLLTACSPPFADGPSTAPTGALDVRVAPEAAGTVMPGDVLLAGPEFELAPGEDVMVCVFGTWPGGDVGLHAVHTWQAEGGHHLQLLGTSAPVIDVPDGTVVDCTSEGGTFSMADMEPLIIAERATVDGVATDLGVGLPDGMAVELEAGQRWVLQSHYVNYGQEALRIRDLARLVTVPAADVTTWAAPLIFSRQDFSLPPGEASSTSFDCVTSEAWNLHSLLGHMHESGTRFAVERVEGSVVSPFYTVEEWDPAYRDEPVVTTWEDGGLALPAGSMFRTTCDWFNDTDAALVFPYEMCVAVGVVYPQKGTVICNGDGT